MQKFNIEVFLDEKTLNYSPIITSFLNNIIENRVALEKFLRDNGKVRAYEAFQELNHNCMNATHYLGAGRLGLGLISTSA